MERQYRIVTVRLTCEERLEAHILKISLKAVYAFLKFGKSIHVLFLICKLTQCQKILTLILERLIVIDLLLKPLELRLKRLCLLDIVPEIRLLSPCLKLAYLSEDTIDVERFLQALYRLFIAFKFESYIVKLKHYLMIPFLTSSANSPILSMAAFIFSMEAA